MAIQEMQKMMNEALKEAENLKSQNRILETRIETNKKVLSDLTSQIDSLKDKKKTLESDIQSERSEVMRSIEESKNESVRILALYTQDFQRLKEDTAKFEQERGEFVKEREKFKRNESEIKGKMNLVDSFVKEWK